MIAARRGPDRQRVHRGIIEDREERVIFAYLDAIANGHAVRSRSGSPVLCVIRRFPPTLLVGCHSIGCGRFHPVRKHNCSVLYCYFSAIVSHATGRKSTPSPVSRSPAMGRCHSLRTGSRAYSINSPTPSPPSAPRLASPSGAGDDAPRRQRRRLLTAARRTADDVRPRKPIRRRPRVAIAAVERKERILLPPSCHRTRNAILSCCEIVLGGPSVTAVCWSARHRHHDRRRAGRALRPAGAVPPEPPLSRKRPDGCFAPKSAAAQDQVASPATCRRNTSAAGWTCAPREAMLAGGDSGEPTLVPRRPRQELARHGRRL